MSAGYSCGTTRRPMNRRFVRSVRRATPDRPVAHRVNRSATDGCNTTSGTASRPRPMPKSASLPAAHSRFFARSFPCGATWAITSRANAAACGDSDEGRHRAI
jgi:hypothetical protein